MKSLLKYSVFIIVFSTLASGCGSASLALPAVGTQTPLIYILDEKPTGPVSVIFPGRSAPTDDPTLGIRETAKRIAKTTGGSVALFSWKAYKQAVEWMKLQAETRRASNEHVRVALAGHSWGGPAATNFATECLSKNIIDEVTVLVTIDAIKKGYITVSANWLLAALPESIFKARLPLTSFTYAAIQNKALNIARQINYYQEDSPILHGAALSGGAMSNQIENHEVWFSHGFELGHGNIDNFVIDIVAEDIRRSFMTGGGE